MNNELALGGFVAFIGILYILSKLEKMELLAESFGMSKEICVERLGACFYTIGLNKELSALLLGSVMHTFDNMSTPRFRAQQTQIIQEGSIPLTVGNTHYRIEVYATTHIGEGFMHAYHYHARIFQCSLVVEETNKTLSQG